MQNEGRALVTFIKWEMELSTSFPGPHTQLLSLAVWKVGGSPWRISHMMRAADIPTLIISFSRRHEVDTRNSHEKWTARRERSNRLGTRMVYAGFRDFTLDRMAWRDNWSNCFRLSAPWQIWVPQERNPQFSYNLAIKGGNRDGSLENSCQLLVFFFQITRSHLRLPWPSWAIGFYVPKYYVTAGLVPGQ